MKKFIILLGVVCFIFVCSSAYAAELPSSIDPNLVIATQEKSIALPNNVIIMANPVTYDEDHNIVWNGGYRYCWQRTQAMQGATMLDSYSRARFEHTWWQGGGVYLDSGRCWSQNAGPSYAQSGTELYDAMNSGVAATYYGIS